MPKPKQLTHFCTICQESHTFVEGKWPFWAHKGKEWYCNKGMDCAGCGKVHKRTGITKAKTSEDGTTRWFCNKWFKKTGNGTIQWEQWSPQEVMSGVHLGEERIARYGVDTEDHNIIHSEQVKALNQSLEEIEGA